jgi:anti-sigma B factor antagonist
METTIYIEQNKYVIELRGDLDLYAVPLLDQTLKDALILGPSQLWVNFQEVSYLSSAGLGVLISHLRGIEQRGIQLVLFNVQPLIYSIFVDLGLDKLIRIFPKSEVVFSPDVSLR